MAVDFPSGPSIGQIFKGGELFYQYDGVAWNILGGAGTQVKTALSQNLIVNPNFIVSQENGNTASGALSYFAADQWLQSFSTSATFTFGRVASRTPRNSAYRLRLIITASDVSIAAGDLYRIAQPIEGTHLAAIGWNGATGAQLVLRFGFQGPAGTYSVSFRHSNGTATRDRKRVG